MNSDDFNADGFHDVLPRNDMVGRYRIENPLGQGGFGITYVAFDTELKRPVALKEYFADGFSQRLENKKIISLNSKTAKTFDWGRQRFSSEAETLAKIHHRNVVAVHDVITSAIGNAYIVMDLVPGNSLESCVKRFGLPPVAAVKSIVKQLLDGCEAIHGFGILHRDITPRNILMRPEGGDASRDPWQNLTPVLIDFGASRELALQSKAGFSAVVTDGYSPPEQYSREPIQTEATDIYALAGTVYFLVTGNEPPNAATRLGQRPPVTPERAAAFGKQFIDGVFKGLEPDIAKRPAKIAAWRAELGSLDEILATPTPGPSRRLLLGAGAAAAGLAVVGGGIALFNRKGLNGSEKPLTLKWTHDCGLLQDDPLGQIVTGRTGAMVAAHRVGDDNIAHMLALRVNDSGDATGEWLDMAPDGRAHAICATDDGGCYVGGTIGASPGQAVLARLGSDWKLVWRRDDLGDGAVKSVLPTTNGIVVGIETATSKAPLMQLDQAGGLVWKIDINKGNNEAIERIVQLAAGGYAVLGSAPGTRETANGTYNETYTWVSIIEKDGTLRNRAEMNGLGSAYPCAIVEIDGILYVSGKTGDGRQGTAQRLFLGALDGSGAKLWQSWDYAAPSCGRALATDGSGRLYSGGWSGTDITMRLCQVGDKGKLKWDSTPAANEGSQTLILGLALRQPGDGYTLGLREVSANQNRLLVSRLST